LRGSAGPGPTLSVDGAYHLLEVYYKLDASPNEIRWRVDGADQTAASFTNAARTCTNSNFGQVNGTSTYSFRVDDWVQGSASGDYPFGAGHSEWLVAGSDGTHSFTANDFSTGDTGTQRASSYTSFFDMVHDPAPVSTTLSTTDNIPQRVIRTTGYVEIAPATTAETGTANGVRALLAWSSPQTQADTGACIARNSAGTAVVLFGDLPTAQGGNNGALADYSETANNFAGAVVTNPGTWTPTEVNAVRWRCGGSDDITPVPTWQNLALEVDWIETSGSTYTKAGFGKESA